MYARGRDPKTGKSGAILLSNPLKLSVIMQILNETWSPAEPACWRGSFFLILAWAVSGSAVFADAYSESWPQWRGPLRNGIVDGAPWPESLEEGHLKRLWRKELPPSFSGPVVVGDRVFVTETQGREYEGVRALNRQSGEEIWRARWSDTMEVADVGAKMGSWIRATPTYDDGQLFVAGMPDVLVCLDADSGKERWRVDFHERYGRPRPELGFVCSPLVVGDRVYVQAADSLVAVKKSDGKSVWRSLVRKEMGQGSYSSPDFAVVEGRPQVLVADIDAIAGVDQATGEMLWKRVLDSYDQGCIVAPILYRGGIFTSTRASQTGFYPLTKKDEGLQINDGWKNKLIVYMSSPIVSADHAYLHLKNGRMACTVLKSGEVKWISGKAFGRYWSMICRQNRILALSNEGRLLLLDAEPERFRLLDSRQISAAETWGYLAMAGKELYVRERDAIAVYRWE